MCRLFFISMVCMLFACNEEISLESQTGVSTTATSSKIEQLMDDVKAYAQGKTIENTRGLSEKSLSAFDYAVREAEVRGLNYEVYKNDTIQRLLLSEEDKPVITVLDSYILCDEYVDYKDVGAGSLTVRLYYEYVYNKGVGIAMYLNDYYQDYVSSGEIYRISFHPFKTSMVNMHVFFDFEAIGSLTYYLGFSSQKKREIYYNKTGRIDI